MKTVKDYIRTIPDFPHEGIMFRDVTTLFADPRGFRLAVDQLLHPYVGVKIDKVVGLEARGFILGGAIAHQLSIGFVPVRKAGKLPGKVISQDYKLEYGEAHIAIRTGPKPDDPDNVVQPFTQIEIGLFASADYAEQYGIPKNIDEFTNHSFVGPNNADIAAPFFIWQRENIPEGRIVLRTNSQRVLDQAILSGTGIGFMRWEVAQKHGLIEVLAPRSEWRNISWLVTHVDLHRSAKVQAFIKHFRDE